MAKSGSWPRESKKGLISRITTVWYKFTLFTLCFIYADLLRLIAETRSKSYFVVNITFYFPHDYPVFHFPLITP